MAPTTITALAEEKTLPSSFIREEDERPKVAYNQFSNEIRVISLAGIDGVDGRRGKICKKIADAFEDWGIFQVVDHGVDAKLTSDMAQLAREFFDLPPEEKLRFDISGGQRGAFIISSHRKGEDLQNWREMFIYFSYPLGNRDYSRWPEKPEGWRAVTEQYSEGMMELACRLLEVLSEAMGLEKEALTKACVDMVQNIVVNYYPKCPQPDLTLGARHHTDPSTITILVQDQVGGLQATRDGGKTWITVQPVEGAFVVNVGDHCHFLSNGRFNRADHRVVVNSDHSRLSIATFQLPAKEAIEYPLKIREGEKAVLDEPINFEEMYRRKVSDRVELERLKKMAKEQQLQDLEKANLNFIREEDERPKVAYNQFSDEIPVISLAGIDEVDGRRGEICKKIAEACEDWGIFQVVDHGVDAKLISDMAKLAREFFALPPEEKLRFDMSGGQKGGLLIAGLGKRAVQEWRELFHYFTYPVGIRDYSRWPEKPEGWRAVTEQYSEGMMGLARRLLEVLSETMGLEKEALTKACVDMSQNVVVNFYPRCPQPDLTLGIRRHTDASTIAILVQDQVGGLQASADGGSTWITVQPVEGALLVNLGDHCHYLSNGRFKSADHRVVVNSDHSRLSIATFQNPAPEATVYPLKIGEGEKPVLEKPIGFEEMYKRNMGKDLELARLKKLAKEQQLQGLEKANLEGKPLEETSLVNPFVFWRGVR